MKAGQSYNVEIRLSNAAFVSREAPFTCRGGIQFGGIRQVGEDTAIQHAVTLANESDGL
jgi:beta-glucosidase